eukprot:2951951-Amphidinium_carterae.1
MHSPAGAWRDVASVTTPYSERCRQSQMSGYVHLTTMKTRVEPVDTLIVTSPFCIGWLDYVTVSLHSTKSFRIAIHSE